MKYLLPALILILGAVVYFAEAADSGFLFPTSSINDNSVGTIAWTSPENATASDDSLASQATSASSCAAISIELLRLVKAGSVTGNDKGTNQVWGTGIDDGFGGSTDLWGTTWTASEINASDFGVSIASIGNIGTGNYLETTDFGFAIPTDATIDGIEVAYVGTCTSAQARVDSVQIKVYYTEAEPEAVAATASLRTGSVQVRTGSINIR